MEPSLEFKTLLFAQRLARHKWLASSSGKQLTCILTPLLHLCSASFLPLTSPAPARGHSRALSRNVFEFLSKGNMRFFLWFICSNVSLHLISFSHRFKWCSLVDCYFHSFFNQMAKSLGCSIFLRMTLSLLSMQTGWKAPFVFGPIRQQARNFKHWPWKASYQS